ncbi:YlbF family regulator [Candidatus Formimonas warabiya]|uniref:YlbF family regulator n=1 Tax=Formimonas warabiya TaxID=1761012 RepID=UPI0011D10392|nr:YlbF family regulator [Candidatus Formimonas warabiya]
MSVYDRAHELARTLQESEEYRKYSEAKEKLQRDEENANMLQEFRRKQLELQIAEMSGEDIEKNAEQLERIYEILSLNPTINEFLTAEYRLARVMTDIQRIIGEALDLWIDLDHMKKYVN